MVIATFPATVAVRGAREHDDQRAAKAATQFLGTCRGEMVGRHRARGWLRVNDAMDFTYSGA